MKPQAALALALAFGLIGIAAWFGTRPLPPSVTAYAGSSACRGCHAAEFDAWSRSHHAAAERDAAGARAALPSDHVTLDGQEHAVVGSVGVAPLVQPLVIFDGRTQVASRAWDTSRREWFDVFADERRRGDWGHWTGRGMTYSTQCASCHGTGFEKRYVVEEDRFDSRWAERAVGCEACHGPRAAHVAAPTEGTDAPSKTFVCAPCHSRRGQLAEGPVPARSSFYDYFEPVLPSDDAFYADGQVKEEDFEWTSFQQSVMSQRGVTCTHCHEPHGAKLRAEGNALCLRCHDASLDSETHTFHRTAPGNRCVSCHMPSTTYMQRHARRDHALTKPLPELTLRFGIPNACNRCHADESAEWADTFFRRWYGDRDRPALARTRAFDLARRGEADAQPALVALLVRTDAPDVVRASAARLLEDLPRTHEAESALLQATEDASPLVRSKAVHAVIAWGGAVPHALSDPTRIVRLAAGSRPDALAQAAYDADRPEGRLRLAALAADAQERERHLRMALMFDPALNVDALR